MGTVMGSMLRSVILQVHFYLHTTTSRVVWGFVLRGLTYTHMYYIYYIVLLVAYVVHRTTCGICGTLCHTYYYILLVIKITTPNYICYTVLLVLQCGTSGTAYYITYTKLHYLHLNTSPYI
jgi:hypothetical protein